MGNNWAYKNKDSPGPMIIDNRLVHSIYTKHYHYDINEEKHLLAVIIECKLN